MWNPPSLSFPSPLATNHIHLLISFGKKVDISELIGDIKRGSSGWIKKQDTKFCGFYWQRGHGASSIAQSQVDAVVNYIKCQKAHHAKLDFEDEHRKLLEKYECDFDERYVWD